MITSHLESENQTARILAYVSDYLGLVAIVALFLAGVGIAYLVRSYFLAKIKDTAILVSVGAPYRFSSRIYITQIFLMVLLSVVLSFIAYLAIFPTFKALMSPFLPADFNLTVQSSVFLNLLF